MDFLDRAIAERRAKDPEFAELERQYRGDAEFVIESASADDSSVFEEPRISSGDMRVFSVNPDAGTLRVTDHGRSRILEGIEVEVLSDGEVRITGASVGQWVRRTAKTLKVREPKPSA